MIFFIIAEPDGCGVDEIARARLLRRGIHISSAGLLSYYLLPPDMYGAGLPRELVVLAFLVPVLAVEAYRWARRPVILGLRENETKRVSAVAWGAVGLAVAFVLFPQKIVVPCVLGMAFVDPLIGELRAGWPRGYPYLPLALYYLICLLAGLGWAPSLVASAVALGAEAPKIPQIDDDFRMLVVPLVALWLLAAAFGLALWP